MNPFHHQRQTDFRAFPVIQVKGDFQRIPRQKVVAARCPEADPAKRKVFDRHLSQTTGSKVPVDPTQIDCLAVMSPVINPGLEDVPAPAADTEAFAGFLDGFGLHPSRKAAFGATDRDKALWVRV